MSKFDHKTGYSAGWDHFTPAPGDKESMECRICATEMTVRRNVNGPTGYVEAISRKEHLHDSFSCPNSDEAWHNQALAIMQWMQMTPSLSVKKILEDELAIILETKTPTL